VAGGGGHLQRSAALDRNRGIAPHVRAVAAKPAPLLAALLTTGLLAHER